MSVWVGVRNKHGGVERVPSPLIQVQRMLQFLSVFGGFTKVPLGLQLKEGGKNGTSQIIEGLPSKDGLSESIYPKQRKKGAGEKRFPEASSSDHGSSSAILVEIENFCLLVIFTVKIVPLA